MRDMPSLVVTRPQPDATLWVQQLQAQGLQAHALPMMVIGPSQSPAAIRAVDQALQRLASYRALMFVSGNAVRYFFEQLRNQGLALPAAQHYWSPGPGTSKALMAEGIAAQQLIQPAAHAAQFDSESLWEQAQHHIQSGDRILIVRGGDGQHLEDLAQGQGRPWLTQQLQQRDVHVDFAPVYERQTPAATADLLAEIDALRKTQAAWLFSSSECLQHLVRYNHAWSWQGHTALTTHPRIALQARQAGFGRVIETQPSVQSITASIESLHDLS